MQNTILSQRLLLRPMNEADAPRIAELVANENIVRMLEQVPWPYSLSDAQNHVARSAKRWETGACYNFAITLPDEGLIGTIGLERQESGVFDLGYWLGERYWGNGYMTEAAHAIVQWAQDELGQSQLESGHFADNPVSQAILTQLGFTPSGKVWYVDNAVRGEKVACLGMRWRAQTAKRAVNQ